MQRSNTLTIESLRPGWRPQTVFGVAFLPVFGVAKYAGGTHFVSSHFTKTELDGAEWLQLSALGHHGYPQPEEGYQEATYNVSDYCPTCGIGGVQSAPFRLRTEFEASHSQIVQLNWVFDEFFLR